MKKIVMLPLDERPCNYYYPSLLPGAGYMLVLPPKQLMGDKKAPADTDALAEWIKQSVRGADACVISLDCLVYGGIVPSRLHHKSAAELKAKADLVRELRKINPGMLLYAFQLIMRCPSYSLSEEEPDYYADCGEELFLYGKYTHLQTLRPLSAEESADFERVKKQLPPEALADFTRRRSTNLEVLMHSLELVKDGTVDYFIVPQDDAAPYGFTSMDQMTVRAFLKDNSLHMRTAMYPSADDTGLTLLARAACKLAGVTPKIYVRYASSKGGAVIPFCEDRAVDETIKYQIISAGAVRVDSLAEADILLAVNIGSSMKNRGDPASTLAYDIERNIAEFITYMRYALDIGKLVCLGDVAYCNSADEELLKVMEREDMLYKIHAYAGWNTSSNTLGTAVSEAIHFLIGKDEARNAAFLTHRYFEDLGYMASVRAAVTDMLPQMGFGIWNIDGKNGKVADAVKHELWDHMRRNFPSVCQRAESIEVEMPWRRMFEIDLKIITK